MLPAAGRAVSSPFPRRCAAFFSVCTSFRPLDTAPELHDNKKLRIDKCKAEVWNAGFPRAGADAGKYTAPLQTQKRVNDAQPQPRLYATRRAMFQLFLRFYVMDPPDSGSSLGTTVSTLLEILPEPREFVVLKRIEWMVFQPFLRFWCCNSSC